MTLDLDATQHKVQEWFEKLGPFLAIKDILTSHCDKTNVYLRVCSALPHLGYDVAWKPRLAPGWRRLTFMEFVSFYGLHDKL
jgi:hypothetical protein